MGITVHWKGEVEDRGIAWKVIDYAVFMATVLGWEIEPIKGDGILARYIIKTEVAKSMNIKSIGKSEKFGVIINPNVKKNINSDDIEISFYSYRKKYIMEGFSKTQVFNEGEVGNLVVHSILILMLMTIKNTWIPGLEITDEGEYYIPTDEKEREEWLEGYVEEYRESAKSLKPFNFEHLEETHSELSIFISSIKSELEKVFGKENVKTPSKVPYDSGR